MKSIAALLMTCFWAIVTVNAQNFEWATTFGETTSDEGNSICIDATGNIYTTGHFTGIVDFDPGAGTTNLIATGSEDIFVQKTDAAGNLLWAKSFGGFGTDVGLSVRVDALGNVYTTGYFSGIVDFDPGISTNTHTSEGSEDVFVQKLDANGNFLWAKTFGGTNNDRGHSISVEASGNVYVTGYFNETVVFDMGIGSTTLSSEGETDIFVSKINTSGNFLWAKSFGASGYDGGNSTTVDASGNVYTTGYFAGIVDFDPGAGITNLTWIEPSTVGTYVQKMDATGNFLWAKAFEWNDGLGCIGNSISTDATGNIYSTGKFYGTVDFDPGTGITYLTVSGSEVETDIYVHKMDASGNFLWVKAFDNGVATEYFDGISSISVDASNNIYTTGSFGGTVDFDPGAGTATLNSTGGGDVFVQKMDASGNFLWAKSFGGVNDDVGQSVSVDATGNVYTTGYFEGTADFNPESVADDHTSLGGRDIFVQKMSQGGVVGVAELGSGIRVSTYPNPSNGLVYVSLNKLLNNVDVTLTDVQGKVVYRKHLETISDVQIRMTVPAGIYFLSVKTPEGQSVLKILKK